MTWYTPLEEYFPMEVLPGAHSTVVRWRKMARLWCSSGVVQPSRSTSPQENFPFSVYAWDFPNGTVMVAPGSVWVNGYYGENRLAKQLQGVVNQGLMVVRFDPALQTIAIVFRPFVDIGGQIQDPDGIWEIPLARLNADLSITDLRRLVPLPYLPPPVTEMPAWVPRGLVATSVGPGAPAGPGHVNAHVAYPMSAPRFVPGRHYRVTASTWWTQNTTGTGIGGQVRCYARDDGGERADAILYQGSQLTGANEGVFRQTSFLVPAFGTSAVVVVTAEPFAGENPLYVFPANSTRIEVEDIGG
jgi:hypothetical protein